jgi:hypothetical protein
MPFGIRRAAAPRRPPISKGKIKIKIKIKSFYNRKLRKLRKFQEQEKRLVSAVHGTLHASGNS